MRTVTFNGETFGEGTDIGLVAVRGLEALQVDDLATDLPRYHGGIPAAAYAAPRLISVELRVRPSTRSRSLAAFEPEPDPALEQPLVIVWDDELGVADTTVRVECRVLRRGGPSRDRSTEFNPYLLFVDLLASDPAVYDNTETTAQLTPFTSSAGLSYPVTYPKSYGAGGTGGGVVLVLGGTWETWPTFTINGPSSGTLTNPRLEYVTGGVALNLTANGGASMTPGQVLVVETYPARRSVAFTTGASRYGKLSADSVFFPLQPGSNELRFRADGTTTGATVDVAARSARI